MKKIAAFGFALLMIFAVFVPGVAALNDPKKEGYQSVVNPNPAGEKSPENIGHLDVLLACRAPQIGGEFTIVPVAVSAPFTNAARVDKAFVDQFVKQFGEPKTEQYLPDGTFDSNYAPGTYLLKQVDGNGGQPEFALVAVKAGFKETVVFLGHGITPADEPKAAEPVFVITEAKYGGFRTEVVEPAHTHTIHHEAVTEEVLQPETTEQVKHVTQEYQPAVPAVTEQVKHVTQAYQPAVPAVTEQVKHVTQAYQPAVPATYRQGEPCFFLAEDHVHAKEVTGNADATNRFMHDGKVYQETGSKFDPTFIVTGSYVPATAEVPEVFHYDTVVVTPEIPEVPEVFHYDTVVVTPEVPEVPEVFHYDTVVVEPAHYHTVTVTEAYDETVNHDATYQTVGYFVDVKTQVQAAVDAGVQNIVFNNAANPGGIFDTEGHLLHQITDPLYGTLKTATIKYTVDGGAEKTVSGQEHQTISIV